MDLGAYLIETDEKQTDFASRVRTTDATISRIIAGTMRPGLDLAARIEKATGGRVPMSHWARDDDEPRPDLAA